MGSSGDPMAGSAASYEATHYGEPLEATFFAEMTPHAQDFMPGMSSKMYPLRRRAKLRTVAEVKWQVPPNLPQLTLAESACDDAICIESADLAPILRELTISKGWTENSPVVLFVQVSGPGMRGFMMMHDMVLFRMTSMTFIFVVIGCCLGTFSLLQVRQGQ